MTTPDLFVPSAGYTSESRAPGHKPSRLVKVYTAESFIGWCGLDCVWMASAPLYETSVPGRNFWLASQRCSNEERFERSRCSREKSDRHQRLVSISLATACDICTSIHRSIALFYPSPGPTKRGAGKQGWTCFPTLHQPFPRLAWPARSEISESREGAAYERVRRFWYTVQYPAGVRRRLQLLSARSIDLSSCRSEARKAGRGRLLATVFDSITS